MKGSLLLVCPLLSAVAWAQDECASATAISPGLTAGTNVGATDSNPPGGCAPLLGSDIWYSFVASGSGMATATFCSGGGTADYDTALAAFSGTCGALLQIACSDDNCGLLSEISFAINSGETYYIAVGGFFGAQGTFTLSLTELVTVPHDIETGDVIAGVNNGDYDIYENCGGFLLTLNDGGGGFTTGAFYDTTNQLLYTTNFTDNDVTVYDGLEPHAIVDVIDVSLDGGINPESIVFNMAGNFYVGHAGSGTIIEYDSSGTFVDSDSPALELRGADWIDLAADQMTMFYTSEGDLIKRYDVVSDAQLADFADLATGTNAYAFRLLPPFDGSGGLIVADTFDIRRLDGAGATIQMYDAPGEDCWFALNLDPNGTSFWAGDFCTDNFYRFDIATGAVECGPTSTGGGFNLFGLAVAGEIAGGVNNAPVFVDPSPCDQKLVVDINNSLSYTVTATDVDAGDIVTLTAAGVPAGATHTPDLPAMGNPVSTTFDWTPGPGDVGTYFITYTATDDEGAATECTVTVCVPPACKELASTMTLGTGCGATLSATNPVLGLPCTVTLDGNTPGAMAFINVSRPGPGGIFFEGCEIFLQPGAFYHLTTMVTDANGDASFTGTIPFNLIKCGVDFTIQAVVIGDQGPTSIGELSNGVLMTFGS